MFQLLTLSCRKRNYVRKLVGRYKWDLICGQIINVMAPLVLPWIFIILKAGVKDFNTKINTAAYLLVFFICLVFPIYYFFSLLG
jgi:hypothetical protein